MRISDWSSDVCSSDLPEPVAIAHRQRFDIDDGKREADALEQIAHRGKVDLWIQPSDRPHAVGHTRAAPARQAERKSAAEGKSVSVRAGPGGRSLCQEKDHHRACHYLQPYRAFIYNNCI